MLAPKGFTQHIRKDAYIAARVAAEKKTGVLRFTVPGLILAAAVVLGAGKTLFEGGDSVGYIFTGIVMMLLAAVCAVLVLYTLPQQVKTQAEQEYPVFEALFDPADVTFESDEMQIKGQCLSRRVEYAKTRLCIETADRYVILTDDDAVVILEKVCFAEAEETNAFLRDVFARWYAKL